MDFQFFGKRKFCGEFEFFTFRLIAHIGHEKRKEVYQIIDKEMPWAGI